MKKADNNEVELLLRALASDRQKGRLPSADGRVTEHLDADELNAFAEGQLPERARARYTEHLADCESCRSILITLVPATGFPVSAPVSDSQADTSLWSRILVFFSPAVLRYAVPALGLAAVIGVSLFALRQQRTTDFVAQHQPNDSSTSAGVQNAAPATQPNATPPTLQEGNVATREAAAGKEKGDATIRDQLAGNTAGTDVTTGAAVKDSPKLGEAAASQAAPSFAPEPQAPAPPPPRVLSDADKSVTLNRQETSEREAAERGRDYRSQPSDEAGPNRSGAKTSSTSVSARRVEGLTAERRGFLLKNKKDGPAEPEMRGIAGRQFRRQGNAWVDTAYDSSRATINVARGSEQFRALVADEPRIGDIANHLGGEVIVVWKGRAYRIR
ncbi:MAG: zf-HC2 domain-containing protein [Acidobacteriota bacterium]|nr:zf-HC2 domain-containing protein [Acidobacteriota bacterium]